MNLEPQHSHSHHSLNLPAFIGAIQTVCCLSLCLTHPLNLRVCVCVGEWVRERDCALVHDLEMKGEVETKGIQPNDLQ